MENSSMPNKMDFNKMLEDKLSTSSLDGNMKEEVRNKLKNLATVLTKLMNESINIDDDKKTVLDRINSEIENTKSIGNAKLKKIGLEMKEEFQNVLTSMIKCISDNIELTREAIKDEKSRIKRVPKEREQQLALTEYKSNGFFDVLKRMLNERKESKDNRKSIFTVLKEAYFEVKLGEAEDNSINYESKNQSEDRIARLQDDIASFEEQLKSLRNSIIGQASSCTKTIKQKGEIFDKSYAKDNMEEFISGICENNRKEDLSVDFER